MKNYAITSGKFTQNGNFTGYTALGERLFVHKAQMQSIGAAKDGDVKFPLFAIGDVKKIGQLNDDNTPKVNADGTPVLVDRLQAMSVFATRESLIAAHVDNATLNIGVSSAIKESASKAGLGEKELAALVAW